MLARIVEDLREPCCLIRGPPDPQIAQANPALRWQAQPLAGKLDDLRDSCTVQVDDIPLRAQEVEQLH